MKREKLLEIAKPILFNPHMVRAILNDRKTQTRRIMKLPKLADNISGDDGIYVPTRRINGKPPALQVGEPIKSCYHIGDILYVRETFKPDYHNEGSYCYKAVDDTREMWPNNIINWSPSIHMPKSAARIFLRVTNVRVERLRRITYGDCCAEGVYDVNDLKCAADGSTATERFRELWDSVSVREHNWESNPWVWVYKFERVEVET